MGNQVCLEIEDITACQTLIDMLMMERKQQQLSQRNLATLMQTKQPALTLMERGYREPRISTLQRYADCLGKRITWQIVDK